jgi:hypothetical protein
VTVTPTPTVVVADSYEPDLIDPSAISCGESQRRSLAPQGDRDRVLFALGGDTAVRIDVVARGGYVNSELFDAAGVVLGSSGYFGPCEEGALAAGSYLIELDGYGYGEGGVGYDLTLLCLPCAGIVPTRTPTPSPSPASTQAPP